MAVREALQKNRFAGVGTGVFLLLVAGAITAYTFWPSGPHISLTGAFFSDDDGKSYYSSDVFHFPPFDHDGKTALRAVVYSGNSGNFVGILERYTPETKKLLEDAYAKVQSGDQPRSTVLQLLGSPQATNGVEFKLPGPGHDWMRYRPMVKPPNGGDCTMVMP
jgi:hypothetical protein